MKLLLASASPRRAELLRAAGIDFDVISASIDETIRPHEASEAYVRRIAQAKGDAVYPRAAGRPVLAADTVVVVGDEVLGKPADAADATRMLRLLSGRDHTVMTAVYLAGGASPSGGTGTADEARPAVQMQVERTVVAFAPLTAAEIDWYVASGEPMDKAGGVRDSRSGIALCTSDRRFAFKRRRPAGGRRLPAVHERRIIGILRALLPKVLSL